MSTPQFKFVAIRQSMSSSKKRHFNPRKAGHGHGGHHRPYGHKHGYHPYQRSRAAPPPPPMHYHQHRPSSSSSSSSPTLQPPFPYLVPLTAPVVASTSPTTGSMLNPTDNPTNPIHTLVQQVNYLLTKVQSLEFHSRKQNGFIKDLTRDQRVLEDRVSDLVRLHTLHCIDNNIPWNECIPFPNEEIKNWYGSTPLSDVIQTLGRSGQLPSDVFFEALKKKGVKYNRADADFLIVMLGVQYQGGDHDEKTKPSTPTPSSSSVLDAIHSSTPSHIVFDESTSSDGELHE